MRSLGGGLSQLSNSYTAFHSGLASYLNGVSALFEGTSQYQSGLAEYLNGVGETAEGSETLKNGIQEYSDGVAEIPDTMQEKVDEMMEEYTSSDYEPVSFTDGRNKNVKSVQFVISTQEIAEPETIKEKDTENDTGFWDRLKALF